MLSFPPSMAGVPAEAQPSAPRMGGAAGAATPAEGAAPSAFDAELRAAGQPAQVREALSRRSDNAKPTTQSAFQPEDTGQLTNAPSAPPPTSKAADRELGPDALAAGAGGAQADPQTPERQGGGPIASAPAEADAAGSSAPGAAAAARSSDDGAAPRAATQTKPEARSGAPAKPAGQDTPLTAGLQSAQSRPDDTLIQAAWADTGPNTGAGAKPGAEAKSDDVTPAIAAQAQAGAASARPSADLMDPSRSASKPASQAGPQAAAQPAGQAEDQPSAQAASQPDAKAATETAAGKTAQPSGEADTAATPTPDMRKQNARTLAEPSSQGLSGLKSDAKAGAGEARLDVRPDAPTAQRAALGQSRGDGARREGGQPSSGSAAEVRPGASASAPASAPASAGPVPAASRPLAELIAMQLQPLAQGAPLASDSQTASLDPLLSGEADAVMDPGQMRAESRADALRTPGQAGQAARFTPHTIQHLAARVAHTAADGGRRFDIRLDPAELGRVRVRLEMGADNSVRAVLSAERADTLAELQRTSRDLVRALEDAGLDLAENGLEFSLSQGGEDQERGSSPFTPVFVDTETLTGEAAASSTSPGPATLYGFALHARARLDVRI
ncbi:flagellar hook-length control protein FliK [Maricaulaceae bacterium MS644]